MSALFLIRLLFLHCCFLHLGSLVSCQSAIPASPQPAAKRFLQNSEETPATPPNNLHAKVADASIRAAAPLSGVSLTNVIEQRALLAMRAEWHDPLQHLIDWAAISAVPLCSWRGVTCTHLSVTSLDLSGLSLSGTLSSSVANLSSLTTLDLSHNRLSGPIPAELGSLPSLTSLLLHHNLFNSNIPSALFLSQSLRFLVLEVNQLSGKLPSTIGNTTSLSHLSLQFNNLSGRIPSSITKLTNLSALFASSNRFTGSLPRPIGHLKRLMHLDLGDNTMTGSLPPSLGSLTELKVLSLHSNYLAGSLPPELGNLQALTALNLSHNSFSGTIPTELGNLCVLRTLDLCTNDLVGTIPSSLGNLGVLASLNLSFNHLSGKIPTNGVLSKFNSTSFMGNDLLCMHNLSAPYCRGMTPMGEGWADKSWRHRMPYDRDRSQFGNDAKITVEVLGGAFALVLAFVLVCCLCRTSRQPHIQKSLKQSWKNSFKLEMARSLRKVSMKKARLEVYIEGFTHSYETIVSHAGFFDTAHVIGKGRFASMFRSDIRGGLSLAVKVFNNPIPQSTFEREMINLHDSTGHINTLLPMRGYYANPVESAIFYDYMPRGSLHDVLRDSPFLLDWSKRIRIAIGVSQALHDLHSCSPTKILHQDLKSSNVLLNHDLQPLLADYGLMGLLFRSVVETPGYTPPEFACLSNSLRRYTEKTDVYAFGVVLLELLTGKDPVCHEENTQAVSDQDGICVPQNHENVHVSHLAKKGRASYDLEEGLGSRMHLVTLVLGLEKEGKGLELLSPIVVETCPSLDKQEEAYRLALLCIDEEPNRRPSMPELISTLERLSMSEMQ